MKKTLFLPAFVAVCVACGSPQKPLDPLKPETPENPGVVMPSISPDSAWVSLSAKFILGEEPLGSKAGGENDLYVVGIHQIIPAVYPHSGAKYSDYVKYAYGVFDDLSHAVVKMSKKYHYGICVAYIPNGKTVLKFHGDGIYGPPCQSIYADSGSPSHTVAKLNQLIYGYEAPELNHGFAEAADNSTGKLLWNQVERYQGFVDDWDVSAGTKAEIELYRMMMGLRVTATDFTKGKLIIYGDPSFSIVYQMTPSDSGTSVLDLVMETPWMPNYGNIDGLGVNMLDWNLENYTAQEMSEIKERKINYGWGEVNIKYDDGEGHEMLLYTTSGMLMKRNTRYTLEFSLSDAVANQGIVTNKVDDGEMEDAPLG